MADQFYENALQFFQDEELVARIGFDDTSKVDHWARHLDASVRRGTRVEQDRLNAVDLCLTEVMKSLDAHEFNERTTFAREAQ